MNCTRKKITDSVLRMITRRIAQRIRPKKIILFGSCARGVAARGSDVDLLVVRDSGLPRHKRAIPIQRLFYDSMIPMDILVYTPKEVDRWKDVKGHILHTIMHKGKVLYG